MLPTSAARIAETGGGPVPGTETPSNEPPARSRAIGRYLRR